MESTNKPSTNQKVNLIKNIAFYLVGSYILLVPLTFTTLFTANTFDFPKWLLTTIVAIILSILTAAKYLISQKVTLIQKRYLISFSLLIVTILASILFSNSNKQIQLMGKGGLIIALAFIAINTIILVKEKAKYLVYPLILSSFFLSWTQILSFFEIMPKITSNALISSKNFTPIGSQIALISFLVSILAITLTLGFKTKKTQFKLGYFLVAGLQSIAAIFSSSLLLPGKSSQLRLLPFTHGWSIAVDQLKNWATALFGVGPDNYIVAFTAFRPASLNAGENWFIKYSSSSNELLTVFTTLGIFGLSALIIYVVFLLKDVKTRITESEYFTASSVGLIIVIASLFFIPANFGTLLLLFILGATLIPSKDEEKVTYDKKPLVIVTVVLFIIIPLGISFLTAKAAFAEYHFGQSLNFAAQNRGTDTYNEQIKAIQNNPYMYRYRVSYSNTNLALANSLATKENISDEDKQKITQLISQSIREAKAAVALNPLNAQGWINLANIYRQLINFAQGSEQWAVSGYIQAIRLDKTNAQLRIELGGLLFSLGNVDDAIDQYKQAISLKPDYANAYFNLSYAYQQQQKYKEAYASMQNVVNLVDPGSEDYQKASNSLKELEKMLEQTAGQQAATQNANTAKKGELSLPEPAPTPNPAGPVQFDTNEQEELAPNEATPLDESSTEVKESSNSAQLTQPEATEGAQLE